MNTHTPEAYIEAMRTALSSGDFNKAQQLSVEALEHYPDHEDIKKCAYILAPAKVTSVKRDDIDRQGLRKSRAWVSKQRRERQYLNQWVGVRDGELLATGNSLDEVVDQIGDTKDVFLTVIY